MLARTILRILTVEVLAGVEFLGGAIEDSLIPEVDGGKDAHWPDLMTVIYTETAERSFGGGGRAAILLAIELVAGVEKALDDGQGGTVLVPAKLTPKAEITCDLAEEFIVSALIDAGNDWADLWREFAGVDGGDVSIKSFCGMDAQGRKRSMRRIEMRVSSMKTPPIGMEMAQDHLWRRALEKLIAEASTEAYRNVAAALKAFIEKPGGDGVGAWAVAMERAGLDRAGATILGIEPRMDADRTKEVPPYKVDEIDGVAIDGKVVV